MKNRDALSRKKHLGVKCEERDGRVRIAEILDHNSSLHIDDIILELNGIKVKCIADIKPLIKKFQSDSYIEVKLIRNKKITVTCAELFYVSYEKSLGVDVKYSYFNYKNYKIRTITTCPKGKDYINKAILFIQGIECTSIDRPYNEHHLYRKLLYGIGKSVFMTIRIDLFGNGDSEGNAASDYSFYEIVDLYRVAVMHFTNLDYEIYLFGYSMGGVMAALIADLLPKLIKGIIVFDTIISELKLYLLRNKLRQEMLQGYEMEYIENANREYEKLLNLLLHEKKTPKCIISRNLYFNKYFSENENFLGHTYLYAQQISDLNIWSVWNKLIVPVIIIAGEQDYLIDYDDHVKLFEMLKKKNKDKTALISAPVNHFFDESTGEFSIDTLDKLNETIRKFFVDDI